MSQLRKGISTTGCTPVSYTHLDVYKRQVVYAYQNSILTGPGETTFSPNGPMTRSMLVTALWRLEGEPEASGASGFPDVKPDAWYAEAVDWASQTGIVSGTGAGFDPEGSVTREQIASILYRYAKLKGLSLIHI